MSNECTPIVLVLEIIIATFKNGQISLSDHGL